MLVHLMCDFGRAVLSCGVCLCVPIVICDLSFHIVLCGCGFEMLFWACGLTLCYAVVVLAVLGLWFWARAIELFLLSADGRGDT